MLIISPTDKCAIHDSGALYILYDSYHYIIYDKNQSLQRITLTHNDSQIQFMKDAIIVRSKQDLYYYDISKYYAYYLARDNAGQRIISPNHNEDFIAFDSQQECANKIITVCERNGSCFRSFRPSQSQFSYKVRSDGKVVVYNKEQRSLSLWSNQLITCNKGSFVSNGQCTSCNQDCASCEAETGACLEYAPSHLLEIILGCLAGLFFIVSMGLAFCLRKAKRVNKALPQHPMQNKKQPKESLMNSQQQQNI